MGIFGFIAAVASFRSGWRATALPLPPPDKEEVGDDRQALEAD